MSLGDLLRAGQEKRQKEREAVEARKAAETEERRLANVRHWQACWKAAADAIDPALVEYLDEEMPPNWSSGMNEAYISIKLPEMAPVSFALLYSKMSLADRDAPQWRPCAQPYRVPIYNPAVAEWGQERHADRHADPGYALAVARERWEAARNGMVPEGDKEELPF